MASPLSLLEPFVPVRRSTSPADPSRPSENSRHVKPTNFGAVDGMLTASCIAIRFSHCAKKSRACTTASSTPSITFIEAPHVATDDDSFRQGRLASLLAAKAVPTLRSRCRRGTLERESRNRDYLPLLSVTVGEHTWPQSHGCCLVVHFDFRTPRDREQRDTPTWLAKGGRRSSDRIVGGSPGRW